jgi:DNA-binding NarL/FixJ family response regulator
MRRICAVSPKTRLVVLTAYESADVLQRAIEAGARAYVAKADAARTPVASLMRKLHLRRLADLVRYAVRSGLIHL